MPLFLKRFGHIVALGPFAVGFVPPRRRAAIGELKALHMPYLALVARRAMLG